MIWIAIFLFFWSIAVSLFFSAVLFTRLSRLEDKLGVDNEP